MKAFVTVSINYPHRDTGYGESTYIKFLLKYKYQTLDTVTHEDNLKTYGNNCKLENKILKQRDMQCVIRAYTTDRGRMAIFLAKLSQASGHKSIKSFLQQGFEKKVDFILRIRQRGETPFKL